MVPLPVFYYISPKIWAWKEYRIKEIKRYVDRMFTIFPFETAFYAKHDYTVEFVGNPSVDTVCLRANQEQTFHEFCMLNNLTDKPIIAVLAGSRKQEITACLPRMLQAALRFKDYQVVVAGAPGIDADFYQSFISKNEVQVVFNQTYELLQQAQASIVNSGTATLETALVGTPQVVVYHVIFSRFGYFVKNIVVKLKHISLVNIVAEKEVVKELLAHQFTVENVAGELEKLLHNESYRVTMQKEYDNIKKSLGEPGAAGRCAKKMYEILVD